MRAFIALDLSEALTDALLDVQEGLPGRPVPEENLHLTLAFLGDTGEMALDEIGGALSMARLPGAGIGVTGLVTFGGRVPRLVAAEVGRNSGLTALHRLARSEARKAGCELPRERFRPHITLTRFRQSGPDPDEAHRLHKVLTARAGLRLPAEPAPALCLVASTLTPDGARHEDLARYPLPLPAE